jgi:hypothetical protein
MTCNRTARSFDWDQPAAPTLMRARSEKFCLEVGDPLMAYPTLVPSNREPPPNQRSVVHQRPSIRFLHNNPLVCPFLVNVKPLCVRIFVSRFLFFERVRLFIITPFPTRVRSPPCGSFLCRDFPRHGAAKDGTNRQCRSCISIHDSKRTAYPPVDTPRRCSICNELKPASAYWVSPKALNGLRVACKRCELEKMRISAAKQEGSWVLSQRQTKYCSKCRAFKERLDFGKTHHQH